MRPVFVLQSLVFIYRIVYLIFGSEVVETGMLTYNELVYVDLFK